MQQIRFPTGPLFLTCLTLLGPAGLAQGVGSFGKLGDGKLGETRGQERVKKFIPEAPIPAWPLRGRRMRSAAGRIRSGMQGWQLESLHRSYLIYAIAGSTALRLRRSANQRMML